MDPSQRRWLNRFINAYALYLKKNSYPELCNNFYSDCNKESAIHSFLHYSGLIFGFPSDNIPSKYKFYKEWSDKDKLKIIFTETLLYTDLVISGNFNSTDLSDSLIIKSLRSLKEFYALMFLTPYDVNEKDNILIKDIEEIIDNRIEINKQFLNEINPVDFHNFFVLIDILMYYDWKMNNIIPKLSYYNSIQFLIFQIFILSIKSSANTKRDENFSLNYFKYSSDLPSNLSARIKSHVQNGITIDEININSGFSILTKEVLLEMAMIATLSDKTISEEQTECLFKLKDILKIDNQTYERDFLLLQQFVLNNYSRIAYYKNKSDYRFLTDVFYNKLGVLIKKNKAKLEREVGESRELVELLWKAKNQNLNEEEKKKIKTQLWDILRTIPSFAIFMVPGGSFILPLLIKILPEELILPSNFRN